MSENRRIEKARRFHDLTTHTPYSVRTSTHTLDWDVKPLPFKIYVDLPAIPLPRTFAPIDVDTFRAIDGQGAPTGPGATPRLSMEMLAALLYHAAGIRKKKADPGGGEVHFGAAASTGALYQTEVYVVVGEVDDLAPGLYHFGPGDFALRRLRDGDVRAALAEAAAEASIASAAATVVLS